jgi:uncharacterized phage protein (TIGR02220 family)
MGFIIIPDAIKSMQKLNPNAKLLYGDILSLSAQNGYCFASNEYLAKIYGVTTRSISNLISQLFEVRVIDIKNDTGQFGKVRTIFPLIEADHEQTFLPPRTNVPRTNVLPPTNERSTSIEQTFQEHRTNVPKATNERSTIIDNIIDNRKDKIIDNRIDNVDLKKSTPIIVNENLEYYDLTDEDILNDQHSEKRKKVAPKKENPEDAKYYFEFYQVISRLSELTGAKYRIPETMTKILSYKPYTLLKALFEDGNDYEIINKIVEAKCAEWLSDAKMCAYLVPDTLFRKSNFEKYLAAIQIRTNNGSNNQPTDSFAEFLKKGIGFRM